LTTTRDRTVHGDRLDFEDLTSRLAADADDRAAQLAFTVESLADEVGQLMRALETLRAAVREERVLLDELRTLQR
jgi:hypothetical protein